MTGAPPQAREELDESPPVIRWSIVVALFAASFALRFAYFYLDDLTQQESGTLVTRLLEEAPATSPATGREAIAAIQRARPDLVFLDIQMPGLNGFEVGAVDYLLKPFTLDRFTRVLERARERLVGSAPAPASAPAYLKRFLLIDQGRAVSRSAATTSGERGTT